VGLSKDPLPSADLAAALKRGHADRSTYVLWGTIESQAADSQAAAQTLTVKILSVEDDAVVWSKSYPASAADPMQIATEVNSNLPSLEDD
jgi:hypothetical protein